MKRIKVLIADKDEEDIKLLSDYFKLKDETDLLATVKTFDKLEKAISMNQPDVVFLDLCEDTEERIKILKELRESHSNLMIVIIINSSSYIEDVINYQIFNCLYQPIQHTKLDCIVNSLSNFIEVREENKIKLPVKNGFLFLNHEEILLLEAEGNYTRITTTAREEYISSYNMGRLYKKLDNKRFFRINRNCVLNSDYLHKIDKKNKTGTVQVNGSTLNVELSNAFISFFNKSFP